MKPKPKIIWYIILIVGCVVGFIWGLTPGTLISTHFLRDTTEVAVIRNRGFLIFTTLYGYLSLLLIVLSMIAEMIYGAVSKSNKERKIKAKIFAGGGGSIPLEKFQQICALSSDEVRMLFGESQATFGYEDYLKARKYLGSFTKSNPFQIRT